MKIKFSLATFVFFMLVMPTVVFGATWPATGITTADTINLPSPYEPSGLAWNEVTKKLFSVSDLTSDGNRITMMNADGSNQLTWKMGGDFEALTIVDPNSNKIYVGVENPDAIYEFDITSPVNSPQIPKKWDLTTWLTGPANSGLEGLAFVPNGFHPYGDRASGGVFYAGVQRPVDINNDTTVDDGLIYAFDVNLAVNGEVTSLGYLNLNSALPNRNVSDLFFSKDTGTLFVLYDDGYNYLFELTPDGRTVINTYTDVPGDAREGVVIKSVPMTNMAEILIAHDSTSTITRHFNFPVVRRDFDGDGVLDLNDCAPQNPELFASNNYYIDQDGDGLGYGDVIQSCSMLSGYVANNNDLNDNDFDNDGVEIELDCDDTTTLVGAGGSSYYQDNDGDGLGSKVVSISVCGNVPVGYVVNNYDFDDGVYSVGVEFKGDRRDNDGDGEIDEINTIQNNGLHPFLSTIDPYNVNFANRYLLSAVGLTNGNIKVRYSDHSVYKYFTFPKKYGKLSVERYMNSAVLKVRSSKIGGIFYVNAYTGKLIQGPQ
ncbi:hypothetical protein A2533_02355 [Candidatus Falkowbacteria bacterium RIFOXYD2_FULL_35_9]|uniref:Phytase-like domain-containing protein n=1 Tax=Candidatus Falkowbacteria bacterium RIFOXYC2_FULL_36_12 TaxID=1798002 RepID=A0A1F5SWA5_9BACT|nr:MAG: hypothetical protein A2300_04755 [Candidatus Falkowbacteria bacterium RIFOXYB2_FULL_35_7]OGF30990.1 MAG: hypothetical protein A2478_00935 [Candidatus Falkowbacteria bacterium RIFOXYC2_FULL_36_12]OGF34418.1 MAG: hypothetical protein A2223_02735 [Candidatus Falkowbacteria bacterium RIFOXYA2_FULL_35_8]OGF45640.1 MAG: hypothetical protein A2533_02355 [Candidatus Falkowbacteria bacterium RIFOXYD2_FULL_35_9]